MTVRDEAVAYRETMRALRMKDPLAGRSETDIKIVRLTREFNSARADMQKLANGKEWTHAQRAE